MADGGPGAEDQLRRCRVCPGSPRQVPRTTPHRGMVTIARSLDETQAAYERSRLGEPAPRWAELYFHSAYDPSVAPEGKHVMSVFAEYAPYTLATGSWEERREAVADMAFAEIARFAPDILECVEARQVLAPPDIERAVGLSAATSSRASASPTRCGIAVSRRGRRCPGSTCAARARIRAAASWRSTAAIARWPCSRTPGHGRGDLSDAGLRCVRWIDERCHPGRRN